MENQQLDQWKKFELKKLVAELIPDTTNEYAFARAMIFGAWEWYSISEITYRLKRFFPEHELRINKIIRTKKVVNK